jgi:hypothetical protein
VRSAFLVLLLGLAACGSKVGLFVPDDVGTGEESPAPSASSPASPSQPSTPTPEIPPAKRPAPACKAGDGWRALADVKESVNALAIDETHVYFSTYPARVISRVPKLGGIPETVTANAGSAWQLAVDDRFVYWSDAEARALRRVEKTGGAATSLVTVSGYPRGIAIGKNAVFMGFDARDFGRVDGVARVPKAGGAHDIIAVAGPSPAIASVGDTAFVATGTGRTIERIDDGAKTSTILYEGEMFLPGVAVTGGFVFFDAHGRALNEGSILRLPIAGGATTATGSLRYPWAMATNGTTIAALDRFDHGVTLWRTNGGPSREAPEVAGQPSAVAMDDACIYVATDQPGFVGVLPID